MINSMNLLAKHLHEYVTTCIINNPEFAYCNNFCFVSSDLTTLDSDTLYICDENTTFSSVLGMPCANFFIVCSDSADYSSQFNSSSNYLVVSIADSSGKPSIYESVNQCCIAINTFYKFAPQLLHANLRADITLTELLKIASKVIQNPLLIMNTNAHTVAHSTTDLTGDEIWDSIANYNIISEEAHKIAQSYGYVRDMLPQIDYILLSDTPYPRPRIAATIKEKNKKKYILTCLSLYHDFNECDYALLYLLADMFSDFVTKNPLQGHIDRSILIKNFFIDIVSNRLEDRMQIIRNAEDLNIELKEHNYLILLFRNDGKKINQHQLFKQWNTIRKQTPCYTFVYANQIIQLVSSKSHITDFSKYGTGIDYKKLKTEPLNNCLVSQSFSSIDNLYSVYTECVSVLDLLPTISTISYYKDYVYLKFITQIVKTNAVTHFSTNVAEQILSYDLENHTSFAPSILEYLKHYMKSQETADVLNIHKNSLMYRIHRSEELFDIDYSDYTALNALQFSLEIFLYSHSH